MKLFLGVDGGQSGTTAMVGDERGRVLGTGNAGPCNHAAAREGRARLERAVRDSVTAACAQAGVDPAAAFAAACFGMSGGPDDKRAVLASIVNAGYWVVTTDAETALSGAMAGGPGIVVIAGTGSIALGRNTADRSARAGGWGYIFGDEGGAFDIARQALRAALRSEEGWGPGTELYRVFLKATGVETINDVLHLFYAPDWPRSRVARLAAEVDGAARNGDTVALQLLANAAQELALLAGAVRRQLWTDGEPVEIAYVGGVFRSGAVFERFRLLAEMQEGVKVVTPRFGPAEGALLEAYRAAGVRVDLER